MRVAISPSVFLSSLSISLVWPIIMSSLSLMPPLGMAVDSHAGRPDVELGMKQILWSPASAAEKWNLPDEEPALETTRWSLLKTSCWCCKFQWLARLLLLSG